MARVARAGRRTTKGVPGQDSGGGAGEHDSGTAGAVPGVVAAVGAARAGGARGGALVPGAADAGAAGGAAGGGGGPVRCGGGAGQGDVARRARAHGAAPAPSQEGVRLPRGRAPGHRRGPGAQRAGRDARRARGAAGEEDARAGGGGGQAGPGQGGGGGGAGARASDAARAEQARRAQGGARQGAAPDAPQAGLVRDEDLRDVCANRGDGSQDCGGEGAVWNAVCRVRRAVQREAAHFVHDPRRATG
mmetsp:Transcript_40975/g.76767  ORF Transcript_40975/g.76767 Transcript_40975/m.76767 type:complete len:247 (+) Transcript_40975:837-1577(+)